MGWLHGEKMVRTADMDIRVTRIVLRKLRAAGHAKAALYDKRDIGGARLVPATIKCGDVYIAVRRLSDVLTPWELTWIADHRAFVQWGSADVTGLLAHLERLGKHWNG